MMLGGHVHAFDLITWQPVHRRTVVVASPHGKVRRGLRVGLIEWHRPGLLTIADDNSLISVIRAHRVDVVRATASLVVPIFDLR